MRHGVRARLAFLTVLFGLTCWCFLWLISGNNSPQLVARKGLVDFLPQYRHREVVDVAFENELYNSLSELELSLRNRELPNEWPKFIWQTSPSKGDTEEEMTTWKVQNPDWRYSVYSSHVALTG
jgi:hypothetical protein